MAPPIHFPSEVPLRIFEEPLRRDARYDEPPDVKEPDPAPARGPYVKAPKSAPREAPGEVLEIGAFVEVTGLQKAPQLNKEVGRLRSYSEETGRWVVAFSNADLGSKAILPQNLRVVSELD